MKRRRKSEEDKVLAERTYLLRAWKKFHAEQLRETLVGLHHDVMTRLIAQLKNLRSARELVAAIEAENWSAVDAHTRLVALHEINTAITRLRERLGQPPIDDALSSEPARAFQLIKNIITRVPRPAEEPPPGYCTAPGKQ